MIYIINLCYHKNVTGSFIEKHLDKIIEDLGDLDELFFIICNKENIPVQFFEKHIDKLDWSNICRNKNIPISFFEKYLIKLIGNNYL